LDGKGQIVQRDKTSSSDQRDAELSAYLDAALGPHRRAALESALAADPALRRELEAFESVNRLVRDTALPVPDLDFAEFSAEVRKRCVESGLPAPLPLWSRYHRPLAAAAGLVLIVTAGLMWSMLRPPGESTASRSLSNGGDAGSARATAIVRVHRVALTGAGVADTGLTAVHVSRKVPVSAGMGPPPSRHTLMVTVAPPDAETADAPAGEDWVEENADYF
jgi:anti-sigma factor RsiW